MTPGAYVSPTKKQSSMMKWLIWIVPLLPTVRSTPRIKDLSWRLGITADELPAAYSISTLMNPMFGRKPNIIGSGLMTEKQYANGRDILLSMMQDVYDDLTPTFDVVVSSSDEDDSRDGAIERVNNSNHQKAKDELDAFELSRRIGTSPRSSLAGHSLGQMIRELALRSVLDQLCRPEARTFLQRRT